MDEEDYEAIRKKNIAERNSIFAEFFQEFKKEVKELRDLEKTKITSDNSENEPPKKRRRTVSDTLKGYRVKNVKPVFRREYNTRSRKGGAIRKTMRDSTTDTNESSESEEEVNNKRRLFVLFPWAKPFQRSIDLMKVVCDVDEENESENEDDDELYNSSRKREFKVKTAPYDPNNIPSVDDITDEMLQNIADRSTEKEYCVRTGSTCHQCRQKTLDTKTVCRSGVCIGVRGQFCGPCLMGRYGENAAEALMNPTWACPPCRGKCNCSICRNRNGLRPTGMLAPTVREEGYSSVMDYLQAEEA